MSDVLVNLGPEKVQSEVVKHFKYSHVASGGGGVVGGEDGVVKGLGNNNQQKGMRIITGLRDNKMVIEDRHGIVMQVGAVWCRELLEQLLGPMEVQLRKSGHNEFGLGVLRVGEGPVGDGGHGFQGVCETVGNVFTMGQSRSRVGCLSQQSIWQKLSQFGMVD